MYFYFAHAAADPFANSFFCFFCLFCSNGSLPGKHNYSFFLWAAEFQFPRVISRFFFLLLVCWGAWIVSSPPNYFADSLSLFFFVCGLFFLQVDSLLCWLCARITPADFNTWRLVARGGNQTRSSDFEEKTLAYTSVVQLLKTRCARGQSGSVFLDFEREPPHMPARCSS